MVEHNTEIRFLAAGNSWSFLLMLCSHSLLNCSSHTDVGVSDRTVGHCHSVGLSKKMFLGFITEWNKEDNSKFIFELIKPWIKTLLWY